MSDVSEAKVEKALNYAQVQIELVLRHSGVNSVNAGIVAKGIIQEARELTK